MACFSGLHPAPSNHQYSAGKGQEQNYPTLCIKTVTPEEGLGECEAMAWSYLALEQDHWADKPSSAPGHLAAVNKVLQLAHLHSALKPDAQTREAGQAGF